MFWIDCLNGALGLGLNTQTTIRPRFRKMLLRFLLQD